MKEVRVIRLDLARSVLKVHGSDVWGRVLVRKQLRRHRVLAIFAQLPP